MAGIAATTNAAQVFEQGNAAPSIEACPTTGTPYEDFIIDTPLPGWQGTPQEWPCQYAGVLDSSTTGTDKLFFWYYRPSDVTDDTPVAIWMNGGPGASSAFANFLLNGPMRITRDGDDISTGYKINLAKDGSWLDAPAHMVYLDQPIGTGFSWGDPLLTTMEEAGDQFIYWL